MRSKQRPTGEREGEKKEGACVCMCVGGGWGVQKMGEVCVCVVCARGVRCAVGCGLLLLLLLLRLLACGFALPHHMRVPAHQGQ